MLISGLKGLSTFACFVGSRTKKKLYWMHIKGAKRKNPNRRIVRLLVKRVTA